MKPLLISNNSESVYVQCGVYSHSGDVFPGESIGGIANQQTGLTHSPDEQRRRTHNT